MLKKGSTALTMVLALGGAGNVFAGEPELKPFQEEAKAEFDTAMNPALKQANEKCGTKVTLKSDYAHYVKEEWAGYAHYAYCRPVLEAISSLCEKRPAYKKVLAKKISSVVCLFAGANPPEKFNDAVAVKNGVVTFTMVKSLGSDASAVTPILEKALDG